MNWGLEFEKLPEEMKQVTVRKHKAFRRLLEAEEQANRWADELRTAKIEFEAAEREYGQTSLRWNPETNTMTPKDALEKLLK